MRHMLSLVGRKLDPWVQQVFSKSDTLTLDKGGAIITRIMRDATENTLDHLG